MPYFRRRYARRRGFGRRPFYRRRYRSRFRSAKSFRSRGRPAQDVKRRYNLNWQNQFVWGGDVDYSFIDIGGTTGVAPSLVYNQGPDVDNYVARTLIHPPQVDFNRLLFRAYLDGANPSKTQLSAYILGDTPARRAPL